MKKNSHFFTLFFILQLILLTSCSTKAVVAKEHDGEPETQSQKFMAIWTMFKTLDIVHWHCRKTHDIKDEAYIEPFRKKTNG